MSNCERLIDYGSFREAFETEVCARGPLPRSVLIDCEEHDFADLCREFVDVGRKHQTFPDTMPAECCRALRVPQGSDFGRGARAVLRVLAAQERPGQGA